MADIEEKAKDALFEFLRNAELNLTPKSIHAQIDNLLQLSNALHEVTRIQGTAGYSAFHHAMVLAQSIDFAVGNLRRIGEMDRLLGEWHEALR